MNVQRGWGLTGIDREREERRGPLVLVGECPAPGWEGRLDYILCGPAFCGSPGRPGKLASIAGLTFREYLETFDRVNVYEQRARAWTRHHRHRAMSQADRILDEVAEGRELVLLGRRVADAFGIPRGASFLQSFEVAGGADRAVVHLFPHPSGRNHWWNDERNRQAAARFLRPIVRRARACYA